MKPYEHIQTGKKVIKTLVNEAKTMDNVKVRLTELNELIKLINSFEEMLNEKYYTEYFDMLILSRLFHTLNINSPEDTVSIKEFQIWLNRDLIYGKDYIKQNIVSFMQTHQLNNSLLKGKLFYDSDDFWNEKIDKTLSEVKSNIIFDKKWKK